MRICVTENSSIYKTAFVTPSFLLLVKYIHNLVVLCLFFLPCRYFLLQEHKMSDNNDLPQTLAEENNCDEYWFEIMVLLYVFPGDTFRVMNDDKRGKFSLCI